MPREPARVERWVRRTAKQIVGGGVPPSPVVASESALSMIYSAEDDTARPSPRLLEVALAAAREAATVCLDDIAARPNAPTRVPVWPGEHYRLLVGLVRVLQPKLVVDIGTYTGLSALALKQELPESSRIVTFDIVDWRRLKITCLREDDFADGRLAQRVEDLAQPEVAAANRELLEQADLIFLDGPHDGATEERILANLRRVRYAGAPILVLDDIRLWGLLKFWRDIDLPKLDLTSFGHWSGTGLVEMAPAS